MYEFRWNRANIEHVGEHGVSPAEAEQLVRAARPPFPERVGDGKYRVRGQVSDGAYLQVVYVFDPPGVVYVIHARLLSEHEKRTLRRRRGR